jgi:uncharacterized protein (TIGR00255 family)
MIASMTGFARVAGDAGPVAWAWEIRSVNGRGLDVKLRLPNGFDQLDAGLREMAGKHFKRGNISATLSLKREAAMALMVDETVLARMLALALDVAGRIPGAAPPRADALLALPGVIRNEARESADEAADAALLETIRTGFAEAIAGLAASRLAEGARIGAVIATLLDEVSTLHQAAQVEAADQPAQHRAKLTLALEALLAGNPPVAPERLAQEIALLATKSDVREELDRLSAHIEAARSLLASGQNIGRKFDFLVQEFNREANTLCSKSTSLKLTATGLEMKAAIEQLREQVQNIE